MGGTRWCDRCKETAHIGNLRAYENCRDETQFELCAKCVKELFQWLNEKDFIAG